MLLFQPTTFSAVTRPPPERGQGQRPARSSNNPGHRSVNLLSRYPNRAAVRRLD
jgi:hypothetical protein